MSLFQGRPLRLAGFVLIGLALAAAVTGGVVSLGGGGNGGDTASPSATTEPAPPPEESGSPQNPPPAPPPASTPGAPPASSAVPPPGDPNAPQPPAPPAGQPVPPPAGGTPEEHQASAKWVTVRVYNNSTIHGLAARAGDDFRAQGWNVAETSNYSGGIIPTTTAYYRPGVADEETAARALGAAFGMRVEPRFDGIAHSSGGVIVIVTNDYGAVNTKGK